MRPNRVEKECANCGAIMRVYPSRIKVGKGLFCGRSCFETFRRGKPHSIETSKESIERRILRDSVSGCWLWTGCLCGGRYPIVTYGGKRIKVHRLHYILYKGNIPYGLEVRHICNVKRCVNPDHLEIGTHLENMNDYAKTRERKISASKKERFPLDFLDLDRGGHRRGCRPGVTLQQRIDGQIKKEKETACWIWTGSANDKGYPSIGIGRKSYNVCRVNYARYNGKIPSNTVIRHKCDTPKCVNPDHLIPGTQKDNVADMIERDRFYRGERNFNAKLTKDQVRDVRTTHGKQGGSLVATSRDLNVSYSTVARILRGKSWRTVT